MIIEVVVAAAAGPGLHLIFLAASEAPGTVILAIRMKLVFAEQLLIGKHAAGIAVLPWASSVPGVTLRWCW